MAITASTTLAVMAAIFTSFVVVMAIAVGSVVVLWALKKYSGKVAELPRRVDPFALREPWRFFVSDALKEQTRFQELLASTTKGPLNERLTDIGRRIDEGVVQAWEVAQRGQSLTDARRTVDIEEARRDAAAHGSDDPRGAAARSRIQSYELLEGREVETREKLEILDARLSEAVARATELGSRTALPDRVDEIADAVDGVVGDLEALRQGLDAAEGQPG